MLRIPSRVLFRTTAATVIAVALASCGDDGLVTDPGQLGVVQVTVSPGNDTLVALDATLQLVAAATDGNGNAVSEVAVTWTSSDAAVARVSATGRVTAHAVGGASITAAAAGVSGTATVTVIQLPTQLTVTRGPATAVANTLLDTVTVEIRDAGGSRIPTAVESVTVAVAANPGGAILGGTTTVAAVAGVATFTTLIMDAAGFGYVLAATTPALTPDTTQPFTILAPLSPFTAVPIDTLGTVGENPDIAIGADGRVHVSYYDADNADLKYATCGTDCADLGNWQTGTVFSASSVGRWSAIAVDPAGVVHLAFPGIGMTDNLGYAACASNCAVSSSWDTATVDTTILAGRNVDLAVAANGALHVSYSAGFEDLHYATCDSGCTSAANWQSVAVDTIGGLSEFPTSLALAGDGRVHITYFDGDDGDLRYATCSGGCASPGNWATTTIASDGYVGKSNAIAVGATGAVHVAYSDYDRAQVWYATCGGECTAQGAWQAVEVDSSQAHVTLAVDGAGVVHLARYLLNSSGASLSYARCFAACTMHSSWSFQLVEAAPAVGWFVKLAVQPSGAGAPHLAYMDVSNGDLRHAQ